MRRTIIFGIVGLIGAGALSGCGLLQNWHGDGYDNGAARAHRVYVAPDPPTPIVTPAKANPNPPPNPNPPTPTVAPAPASRSTISIQQYPGPVAPPTRPIQQNPGAAAPPANVQRASIPINVQTIEPPLADVEFSQPRAVVVPVSAPVHEPAPQPGHVGSVTRADIPDGHSDNYQILTGVLESYRKTWRLRYAPIDQEDRYGGVVVLDGVAELQEMREGLHLRVRGALVPPAERNGSAHFRFQAIEFID